MLNRRGFLTSGLAAGTLGLSSPVLAHRKNQRYVLPQEFMPREVQLDRGLQAGEIHGNCALLDVGGQQGHSLGRRYWPRKSIPSGHILCAGKAKMAKMDTHSCHEKASTRRLSEISQRRNIRKRTARWHIQSFGRAGTIPL